MEKDIETLVPEEQNDSEKGASMLEYALLAALIAVVCIAAISFLGKQASEAFSQVGSAIGST
jgi:pilus assembly protein Flp/PilA